MTTRFKPDDLTEGLTGAIHETGHALYEQSRNLKYDGLPVNEVPLLPPGLTHPLHFALEARSDMMEELTERGI